MSAPVAKLPADVRCSIAERPLAKPRGAILIDRDGTLTREVNYLHRVRDVRFQANAARLVRAANEARVAVVEVSNQSGIARGMFGWDAYDAVEAEIDRRLFRAGAHIDARIACGYHPDHTPHWARAHAHWRKPGPGMLLWALQAVGVRPRRAWMVGDMATDAEAARTAGLAGCVHLSTGHGTRQRAEALALAGKGFEVLPAGSMGEAHDLLAERGVVKGRG